MANGNGSDVAWVTGAAGFLGQHVGRALAEAGYRVVGFARDNDPDAGAAGGFLYIERGAFEPPLLRDSATRFGAPALVFHGIGSGSVGQALADPDADAARTLGTLETLGEVLGTTAARVRLLYPSSAAVYGDAGPGPIAETAPTRAVSVYGRNKLAAEAICRRLAAEHGFELVILRLFSAYGAPQRKLLFWDLGRRALAGERTIALGGTGAETRDFIDVHDIARAIAMLARMPEPPQILNVGSGRATTIATAARLLVSALGMPSRIEFTGATRAGDPPHYQADIGRLQASAAFCPAISLEAGIAAYAAWLRNLGPAA